jgi:phenylacetate-CoA ligase
MTGLSERIYFASPVWAQQILIAGYGWWWYRRRFGKHFHGQVAEFKANEYWTAGQFQAYQEEQLGKILTSAWRSPYYRQLFTKVGLRPSMAPFEALRRLPLLSKEQLRTRAKDLLSEYPPPRGTIVFKSSGTTGAPTEIYYTEEFHALEMALGAGRSLSWADVSYRDRRVMFGVRKVCHFEQNKPPFWRFSPVENMAYASIYHLSPKFLPYYLEFLRSYHPAMIMGYPSALHTISRYALENNDFPAQAKAVFTTSETVTAKAREIIESVWRCRVYDRYAAVEGCLFASQCEYGRYHISPEVGIIELIDHKGEPVPPGMNGEVICTGLRNTLQPLIRYRIGDVARWAVDQYCPCRRQMPILEAIDGRLEDICYTNDGREMLRFDTVFKGIKHIQEGQVVQDKIDSFTIYVVTDGKFDIHDIEIIQKNMQLHVGDVHLQVKPVNEIPRSKSGKFRAVVCNISAEEKRRLHYNSTLAI